MSTIRGTAQENEVREIAREVARQEISSLAGLILSRTSMDDAHLSRSIERNAADDEVRRHLAEIFGEALADFSGHSSAGHSPGE